MLILIGQMRLNCKVEVEVDVMVDVEEDTRKPNGFNWPTAIQVTREHGKLIYVAHATDRKCSLKEFRSGMRRLASNRIESNKIGSDRIVLNVPYTQ